MIVQPSEHRNALSVEISTSLAAVLPTLLPRLRCLFDLDARPDVIADHLSADPRLARVASQLPGLRVPGAVDGFEMAVRAILGQRISVPGATTLAGRLAASFGEPIETPFPTLKPDQSLPPNDWRWPIRSNWPRWASPRPRARAIIELARAVAARRIDLVPGADPDRHDSRVSSSFPASATGQRIASRCVPCDGPMPFRPPIWGCSRPPA